MQLAHSRSGGGRTDTVADHLQSVAARAATFAAAFGAEGEARLAGVLHDLGKYGELFQQRLRGEAEHVDHWSAGAWFALDKFRQAGLASALAVQGHHVGLQQASHDALARLNPENWDPRLQGGRRLSAMESQVTAQILAAEGLTPVAPAETVYSHSRAAAAAMLDVRMLFSALVDADYLETEAHFRSDGPEKRYRPPAPELEPARALRVLRHHVRALAQNSQATAGVNALRADLLRACLDRAPSPPGLFTLTAPTGSGKTLAMMAFALRHAVENGLRRIIIVIPYLSIIEQTVHVYRTLFGKAMGDGYVLEHHSLAGTRGEDDDDDANEAPRLQAENWDAPVVVTTSVQLLESLFANRPSACRKLHRLAGSVILFDEVQTLPTGLALPTLATISRLVERYRASAVFATATQPAFGHLDSHVRQHCSAGWQPQEIVPAELRLADRARRTRVAWPQPDRRVDWGDLAAQLAADDCRQALCVVNLKRHALGLYRALRQHGASGVCHLSTNMCPAHRKQVLNDVRRRLAADEPCRLVSTQCVEAGVDLDFPVVYRAWGPLDSIAQAAGRCNRNGRLAAGEVRVFVPVDEQYPPGGYAQAAAAARIVAGLRPLDIDDPAMFGEYYRQLYGIVRPEERNPQLMDAIAARDFVDVARRYRVIEQDAVNVLVPYDPAEVRRLLDAARGGLTREWIARARPHAVNLFRPKHDDPVRDRIVPLASGRGGASDDWFEYVGDAGDYDPATGLDVAGPLERVLIA